MPQVMSRHRIQFPPQETTDLNQDEIFFYLIEEGDQKIKLRFHDYNQIYLRPRLYEELFYDRLKCSSPNKVGELLQRTLAGGDQPPTELRVLDQSREGATTLDTMSPGECVLTIRSFDQLGHIHLEVSIARAVYYFGETDHFRCRLRFEIDPTAFPVIINELAAELVA